MTKQSNYPLIEISKQQVEKLCKEEKETLAAEFVNGRNKSFGTVDLWNIERQKKTRNQKRILSLANL